MKTVEGVELELGKCTLMPINYKEHSYKELEDLVTVGATQPFLGCHPEGVTEEILAKAWEMQHSPRIHVPNYATIEINNKIEKERKKAIERYEKILIKLKPENYTD